MGREENEICFSKTKGRVKQQGVKIMSFVRIRERVCKYERRGCDVLTRAFCAPGLRTGWLQVPSRQMEPVS